MIGGFILFILMAVFTVVSVVLISRALDDFLPSWRTPKEEPVTLEELDARLRALEEKQKTREIPDA